MISSIVRIKYKAFIDNEKYANSFQDLALERAQKYHSSVVIKELEDLYISLIGKHDSSQRSLN